MRNLLHRILFLLAAVWFAALTPPLAAGQKKQTARPNIIIIIADDVGWNDLGCYGHPHIRTPNLDKLAKQGMKFTHAFLTTSSCSPSRASIMTGRYPHNTGAPELHQPLPANQVVFAGLLKRAGYFTASVGKWHLGNAAKVNFDRVIGGSPSGCENWVKVLKERPRDRPFFLWLASLDAHRGYKENTIANPHTEKDAVVPPFLPDNSATRKDLAQYYDEITRLDSYVGRVLAELRRQGIVDNTLVLFLSDNGRPFPRCKTTLYDSGIRTPFIVRWPGHVQPGSVSHSLVSVVDIAPTMLEVAGAKAGPSFQGKSFTKVLSNPKATIRDYIFAEHNWHDYQAHQRAVRSKRFLYIRNAFPKLPMTPPADAVRSPTYQKMIELHKAGKLSPKQEATFKTPSPKEELYDMENDPYCLKNLVADRHYAKTLKTMRRELDQWINQTHDRVAANPTPDQFDRTTGKRLKKGR